MRKRRANGNLYPLNFEDRRRRGSYKNHEQEFAGIERRELSTDELIAREMREVSRLSKEILEDLRPRTTWEQIVAWLIRTIGGSPFGGDRLL